MAATPPPSVVVADSPEPATYPQAEIAPAAPARPDSTPSWVDPPGTGAGSHNQFGTPVGGSARGGTSASGFGAPIPTGRLPGTGPERHSGKLITIAVLLLAIAGGGAAFGVPRYLTARDQGVAASKPDVLARTAPATLAGTRRAARPDPRAKAETVALTSQGSTWTWSGTYGSRTDMTFYVASDVPLDLRDEAVRALGSRSAALSLMSTLATATVAGGGTIVMGTATEYASPVGGKTWCMPVTASGVSGGFCTWTNGKEWLQVLASPGVEQSAAKDSLAALAQLAKITTGKPAA